MKDVTFRRPCHVGRIHPQDAASAMTRHVTAVVVHPFAKRTHPGVAGHRRFLEVCLAETQKQIEQHKASMPKHHFIKLLGKEPCNGLVYPLVLSSISSNKNDKSQIKQH